MKLAVAFSMLLLALGACAGCDSCADAARVRYAMPVRASPDVTLITPQDVRTENPEFTNPLKRAIGAFDMIIGFREANNAVARHFSAGASGKKMFESAIAANRDFAK